MKNLQFLRNKCRRTDFFKVNHKMVNLGNVASFYIEGSIIHFDLNYVDRTMYLICGGGGTSDNYAVERVDCQSPEQAVDQFAEFIEQISE